MRRTLPLLLAMTGLVACDQKPESAQQDAAIKQFHEAQAHQNRANSGTRPQPVKVSKKLKEYQELYVGNRDTDDGPQKEYYAKTKARMQGDPRGDVLDLNKIRQDELDKALPALTSLATDEAGRPDQKLAGEIALAEHFASKGVYTSSRASNRWSDHTHLVSRNTEDASLIRVFSAKASVLVESKYAKGRAAVEAEKGKVGTRTQTVDQAIQAEQGKIDQLNGDIATWSKQRDDAYIAADKSSRAAFTKTGEEKANLELEAVKSRDKARELELKIDKAKTELHLAMAAKSVEDASKAALGETDGRLDEAGKALDNRITKNAAGIAHCYEAIKLALDGFGGEKAPGKGFDKNVKTIIDLMNGEVAESFDQADKDFTKSITHLTRAQKLAKSSAAKGVVALQLASAHANKAHALHRKKLAYEGYQRMLQVIDMNLTADAGEKRVDASATATAAAAQMRDAAGKTEDAEIKSRVESGASMAENAGPRISTVHEQVKAALTETAAVIEAATKGGQEHFAEAKKAVELARTHKDARVKLAANRQLAGVLMGNGQLTGNTGDINQGITLMKANEAQKTADAKAKETSK